MAHSSANSMLQQELLDTIKGLRATIESLQSTIEDLRKALSESQERERLTKEQIEVMTKRLYELEAQGYGRINRHPSRVDSESGLKWQQSEQKQAARRPLCLSWKYLDEQQNLIREAEL